MITQQKSYIICTTARSGSNLFCNYLQNTGVLGRPSELLNPDVIRKGNFGRNHDFSKPISVEAYLKHLLKMTEKKGVFGIKILYEDLEAFRHFSAFSTLLKNSFLIHLRRRSKLRQALSYLFAEETGQWVATDPPRKRQDEVGYDFNRIDAHLRRLIEQDTLWTSILEAIKPAEYREIYLEDFLADPATCIHQVFADIGGAALSNAEIFATLEEQRNPYATEFAKRFRQDLQAKILDSRDTAVVYKQTRFIA